MPRYAILADGGPCSTYSHPELGTSEDVENIQLIDWCMGPNPQTAFENWIKFGRVGVKSWHYGNYRMLEMTKEYAPGQRFGTPVEIPESWNDE